LAASGAGNIQFTTANVATTQVGQIVVTPVLNGCSGVADTFQIIISPRPLVNDVADVVQCSGQNVAVIFTGNQPAAIYDWTNDNPSIGLAAAGSGNLNFIGQNVLATPQTATITVTPHLDTCFGVAKIFRITIKPTPSVSATRDTILCGSMNVTLPFTTMPIAGATVSWTNANTAIGLAASGNGDVIFTTNNVTSIQTSQVIATPILNGCLGQNDTFNITISPTPTVNDMTDITKCGGDSLSFAFAGSIASAVYNWTNDNPTIGLPASGTGNLNFKTAQVSTNQTATITVTPTLNGCNGTPKIFKINVKPTPSVSATSDTIVCGTTPLTIAFSGNQAGSNFEWTNSNPLIGLTANGIGNISFTTGAVAVLQTGQIVVTPVLNGCYGQKDTFNLSVTPSPTVDDVANRTICGGDNLLVPFTGSQSSALFSWTNDNPSIGLAAAGTGDLNFISTNATTTQTAHISVTPTLGACIGATKTFTITIKPTSSVLATLDTTFCGDMAAAVNFTTNLSGTTVSWTNSNPAIGLAASGVGNIAFTTANVSTAQTAQIIVAPNLNGCTGAKDTFALQVTPTPIVFTVADQTYCGSEIVAVNFGSNVPNTTFTWINDNPNIGLAATGSGNLSFITNSSMTTQVAFISVTPTIGGCAGVPKTFKITVNPTPTITPTADQQVCTGQAVRLNFAADMSGTVFNWTNNNTRIGLATAGTGNIRINAAPSVSTVQTGTVIVTPEAVGCLGKPDTFTIKVSPTPIMDVVDDITICSGDSIDVAFAGSQAGITYNWEHTNTLISLPQSGTGDIAARITSNSTATQIVTITVTPTLNGCVGLAQTFVLTVKPAPKVTIPLDTAVCAGQSLAFFFGKNISGATVSWTNDNPTTGLGASGTGDIPIFTTINNSTVNVSSNLTIKATYRGCVGDAKNLRFTVKPLPQMAAVADQIRCANEPLCILFSSLQDSTAIRWTNNLPQIGIPANGQDSVKTAALNGGLTAVTATITRSPIREGCVGASDSFKITVNPIPAVATVDSIAICSGQSLNISMTGNVTGTTFNWVNLDSIGGLALSGSGDISAASVTAPPTATVARIVVTPMANGCLGTAKTIKVLIKGRPTIDTVANQTVCAGQPIVINFTTQPNGGIVNWTNDNPSIGIAASGTGNISLATSINTELIPQVAHFQAFSQVMGCGSESGTAFSVTVLQYPVMDSVSNVGACFGDPLSKIFSSTLSGTSFEWTNDNPQIGIPASGVGELNIQQLANPTNSILTATITVTPVLNGCRGLPRTFKIVVAPHKKIGIGVKVERF
jgi:hypothetical protein